MYHLPLGPSRRVRGRGGGGAARLASRGNRAGSVDGSPLPRLFHHRLQFRTLYHRHRHPAQAQAQTQAYIGNIANPQWNVLIPPPRHNNKPEPELNRHRKLHTSTRSLPPPPPSPDPPPSRTATGDSRASPDDESPLLEPRLRSEINVSSADNPIRLCAPRGRTRHLRVELAAARGAPDFNNSAGGCRRP